jgi:hypothetical protein
METVSVANVNTIQNAISSGSVRSVTTPIMGSRENLQIFHDLTK